MAYPELNQYNTAPGESDAGEGIVTASSEFADLMPKIGVYTATPGQYNACETACLSADERDKVQRFRRPEHQLLQESAHVLLRNSLSEWASLKPHEWRFSTLHSGKPAIVNNGLEQLQFSLSHTTDLAVCAIRWGDPLGIDVEKRRVIPDLHQLSLSVLTSVELAFIGNAYSTRECADRFLQIWTRKEAYVKALGVGLAMPFHSFSVIQGCHDRYDACLADSTPLQPLNFTLLSRRSHGLDHYIALAVRSDTVPWL